jgi:bile acid-coenzyme A ligase
LGQRVHAVVRPSGDLTEADLREFVATQLVGYKCPSSYQLVDRPLRDEAGKARRAALRETHA